MLRRFDAAAEKDGLPRNIEPGGGQGPGGGVQGPTTANIIRALKNSLERHCDPALAGEII